jgi:hypothetical protein
MPGSRVLVDADRLRELEWAGTHPDMIAEKSAYCVICMGWRHVGHNPGCWLAELLGSEHAQAPL